MLDPETCSVADAKHWEAWGTLLVASSVWWVACGMWQVVGRKWQVAKIMTSVYIIVWLLSFTRPPRRNLTMPHDHGVGNWSLRFCRNGRQLDRAERRSPTQIFQWYLLLASHGLWACVSIWAGGDSDDGDGDDGDGDNGDVDDGDGDVSEMVIIVPDALR